MKDYSRKIDSLVFLRHYLVSENEIAAKYSNGHIAHYPSIDHNIEALNRELENQLKEILQKYLPELKIKAQISKRFLLLNVILNLAYIPDSVQISLQNDNISLAVIACIMGGGSFLILLLRLKNILKELNAVEDMEFVNEMLKDFVFDNIDELELSESGKEQLQKDGKIDLNNIDCFTHKDIQMIKRYKENENIK